MARLDKITNAMAFRDLAKMRLPAPMFHYIDGGGDDEWTLRRNTEAFAGYELVPHYLRDVSTVDMKTGLFGTTLDLPFFLSPTGMTRLFHHTKEPAVVRAADKFGTMYSLSTLATTTLEDVAAIGTCPKMFQIYVFKDRDLTREMIQRCKDAGYTSLCLTVDLPIAGNRERDTHTGMQMPPRFTMNSLASFAAHPHWAFHLLTNPDFQIANVAHRVDALKNNPLGLIQYINGQIDNAIGWDDAAWMIEEWGGPFAIKGTQSVADAKRAVEIGASALMISNHGGRQLDGAPAPVDCVRPLRAAVGDDLELIVDGGVRRGTHILKALALGADACSFGRPYLYSLAAAGQAGVERMMALMVAELDRDMKMLGVTSIDEVKSNGDYVQRVLGL